MLGLGVRGGRSDREAWTNGEFAVVAARFGAIDDGGNPISAVGGVAETGEHA
jgi:hypothetical protein